MDSSREYFDWLCRTCMHELAEVTSYEETTLSEQKWRSISEKIPEYDALSILELLSITIPKINLQLNDKLPTRICLECFVQLQNAYRFQKICQASDQQMHKLLEEGVAHLTTSKTSRDENLYADPFLKLEFIDSRDEINSAQLINRIPEVTQTVSADPLQSVGVKNEPHDDEDPIDGSNENEALLSAVNVKKETLTDAKEDVVNPAESIHKKRVERKEGYVTTEIQPKEKNENSCFKCDICSRIFQKSGPFHRHRSAHDKKATTSFTCNLCKMECSSRYLLWTHKHKYCTQNKQNKLKLHSCETCDKVFRNPSDLKDHLNTHTGERPYLCPECGKSFIKLTHLKQHRLRHSEVKSLECPHCPKKFRCNNDLSKHKVIHREFKKHICDICGDSFAKAYQLTTHKRYHTGEKRHKCDYCDMRFVVSHHKRRHMRTHTGEKPYKCKYCDRAFAQSNDNIKHLRTHVGDNVYRCELCPLAFRLASELRTHFVTHKNDDEETREKNMKALKEVEAELEKKISANRKQQKSEDK